MKHGFVTVVVPFDGRYVDPVNRQLDEIDSAARLAFDKAPAEKSQVHFMSINAIFIDSNQPARLVLEASVDGNEAQALKCITDIIGDKLLALLATAGIKVPKPTLSAYLIKHQITIGAGWFSTSGVPFSGVPGLSVERIRQEALLAAKVGELLQQAGAPGSALKKLECVRATLFDAADMKWAFMAEPVPLLAKAPTNRVWPLVWSFTKTLLWPLALPPLIVGVLDGLRQPRNALRGLDGTLLTVAVEIVFLILAFASLALKLRRDERRDSPLDVEPGAALVREIMDRENHIAQNHLASVATLKPGRRLILRLVFWAVGAVASFATRPGFLSGIGTIHFARWFVLPGTDRLLFFSNYDGSWNSYLEDFIMRAHQGLTAIWSNVANFPKTRWLVCGGASDGPRFKRIARRQQQPSRFWYSAYPTLTMSQIRVNAAIRHGFASISDEVQASRWLESFGQYPAPPVRESHEVPTLVFGGLSRLRHGHYLIVELGGTVEQRTGWLGAIAAQLSYGELAPSSPVAVTIGFTAQGLASLGLDPAALATFPTAFQQGMTEGCRARALGDEGADSHQHWWWGGDPASTHVLLAIFANDPGTLRDTVSRHKALLEERQQKLVYDLRSQPLPPKGEPVREPFGFVDGISQPIMNGEESTAATNSLHSIKPGELILGYANNSGYVAPTPRYQGYDIGRNGTYLVVRQLQQRKGEFNCYLQRTATELSGAETRYGLSAPVSTEWIAAKMVGRWPQDGSPLVEYPGGPKSSQLPPPRPDNDFLYGKLDPHGLRCPLGAHIRRANPRDSFAPDSKLQIDITNRHRIRRVGRAYEEGADGKSSDPGLMFMCINADIETQFEFLQQTWLLGRSFAGLDDEADPMLGGHHAMSIQTRRGPLRLKGLPDFVTVRGGGYFFMPSKSVLNILCRETGFKAQGLN